MGKKIFKKAFEILGLLGIGYGVALMQNVSSLKKTIRAAESCLGELRVQSVLIETQDKFINECKAQITACRGDMKVVTDWIKDLED